jgi:hypothetical protein
MSKLDDFSQMIKESEAKHDEFDSADLQDGDSSDCSEQDIVRSILTFGGLTTFPGHSICPSTSQSSPEWALVTLHNGTMLAGEETYCGVAESLDVLLSDRREKGKPRRVDKAPRSASLV